jgi:tetratricopeptide (TPR) repeat protein
MPTVYELENEAEKLKDEGKYDEAIARLKQALEIDESFVRAHLALAVVYQKAKNYEESVKHAVRACELEPDEPFNYTALSVTYQRAFAGTQDHNYIRLAEDAMAKAHMLQNR